MFRFNPKGDFNVPYGGFSYNNKCFACKIEKILDPQIRNLFSNAHMYNDDFENVMTSWETNKDDFMFLDPPI